MKRFITIAGNIGAGKTTLANLLSQKFKLTLHDEKFADNPYLTDFYTDMKRWSFHSQIFFLSQNFKAHLAIQQSSSSCLKDRSIYEDSEVFAANLHKRGLMSDRDYECYTDIYQTMLAALQYPDLFIYLRASVPTLCQRIRQRNRHFEKNITPNYLRQINNGYEKFISRMQNHTNVLIVQTDQFNIFEDNEKLEQIYHKIETICFQQTHLVLD